MESTTTFTPGISVQILKASAFVRNQGKMNTMKDDLKFCDAEDYVWLQFSCLLHFAKELKCLKKEYKNTHKHTYLKVEAVLHNVYNNKRLESKTVPLTMRPVTSLLAPYLL